jgi:hypothetical protein
MFPVALAVKFSAWKIFPCAASIILPTYKHKLVVDFFTEKYCQTLAECFSFRLTAFSSRNFLVFLNFL